MSKAELQQYKSGSAWQSQSRLHFNPNLNLNANLLVVLIASLPKR